MGKLGISKDHLNNLAEFIERNNSKIPANGTLTWIVKHGDSKATIMGTMHAASILDQENKGVIFNYLDKNEFQRIYNEMSSASQNFNILNALQDYSSQSKANYHEIMQLRNELIECKEKFSKGDKTQRRRILQIEKKLLPTYERTNQICTLAPDHSYTLIALKSEKNYNNAYALESDEKRLAVQSASSANSVISERQYIDGNILSQIYNKGDERLQANIYKEFYQKNIDSDDIQGRNLLWLATMHESLNAIGQNNNLYIVGLAHCISLVAMLIKLNPECEIYQLDANGKEVKVDFDTSMLNINELNDAILPQEKSNKKRQLVHNPPENLQDNTPEYISKEQVQESLQEALEQSMYIATDQSQGFALPSNHMTTIPPTLFSNQQCAIESKDTLNHKGPSTIECID
ncbi:MAG: hypothetical protein EP298_12935 [Gammaproteobacteria bacterium]|nr:MAG: hypothetical protein EP298_12935 [Gammaproteobacteria bacterium]UTW42803.1 hypothetical protein KFE69_01250 [bacterium SCSIO 12844]